MLKVIITGSTGMVGEGVLHRCINHPLVEEVLLLNRKPYGLSHPKIRELITADFMDLKSVESNLKGYDACFFCAGISSVGIGKEDYEKVTYQLTLTVAKTLVSLNPGMTFTYVSGQGTDSSESGRSHWARVKGKTENELRKLGFRQVFAYRPGFILPMKGMKHTMKAYSYMNWLFPIGRLVYPDGFSKLQEVGDSMLAVTLMGYDGFILNGREIRDTSDTLQWTGDSR